VTKTLRFCVVVLLAASALAAAAGCGRSVAGDAAQKEPEAEPVETVRPTARQIRRVVEQPGQIESDEQTALYARVSGYVKAWHADVGDEVKAGQLLAELSVPELDQELQQKKAAVVLAKAEVSLAKRALETAKANVKRAEAAVRQAEAARKRAEAAAARWSSEYDRGRKLVQSRSISSTEYESIQDQHRSAQATVAESKASIDLASADQSAREADLAQAEAKVEVAAGQLSVAEADRDRLAALVGFSRITAPFAGVVTRRQVEKGHLVQPPTGQQAPGTELFMLARTDRVRVTIDVPESAASHVRSGTGARVRVQALGQQELEANVSRTSWALSTQTRTLRAQVDLDNKQGVLRPGMFVSVALQVQWPKTLMAPASAVYGGTDERPYVMLVDGGHVRRTYVRLGERQGAFVELLGKRTMEAEGEVARWERFTGDDELIASNPGGFEDGQAIAARPMKPALADGGR
jgi:multidrug efflux pump subunit AcrA (membrane-fusion protein)